MVSHEGQAGIFRSNNATMVSSVHNHKFSIGLDLILETHYGVEC